MNDKPTYVKLSVSKKKIEIIESGHFLIRTKDVAVTISGKTGKSEVPQVALPAPREVKSVAVQQDAEGNFYIVLE